MVQAVGRITTVPLALGSDATISTRQGETLT